MRYLSLEPGIIEQALELVSHPIPGRTRQHLYCRCSCSAQKAEGHLTFPGPISPTESKALARLSCCWWTVGLCGTACPQGNSHVPKGFGIFCETVRNQLPGSLAKASGRLHSRASGIFRKPGCSGDECLVPASENFNWVSHEGQRLCDEWLKIALVGTQAGEA